MESTRSSNPLLNCFYCQSQNTKRFGAKTHATTPPATPTGHSSAKVIGGAPRVGKFPSSTNLFVLPFAKFSKSKSKSKSKSPSPERQLSKDRNSSSFHQSDCENEAAHDDTPLAPASSSSFTTATFREVFHLGSRSDTPKKRSIVQPDTSSQFQLAQQAEQTAPEILHQITEQQQQQSDQQVHLHLHLYVNQQTDEADRELAQKLGQIYEQQTTTTTTAVVLEAIELTFAAPDPDIDALLENNRKWVREVSTRDSLFFPRLGLGQAPKYLYFGCSDSRVGANQILGLAPGEVFVHRNVGNIIPANDISSLTVLEYAVEVLNVQQIIVTGHYDCGAIKAAMQNTDHGFLEIWIRNIRDVRRLHDEELAVLKDEGEQHRRLVELNVVEQCLNLYKTAVIQRKHARASEDGSSYPRIHGLVFDPKDGILRKLPIDFRDHVNTYRHIYRLFSTESKCLPKHGNPAHHACDSANTTNINSLTADACMPPPRPRVCACDHHGHE